jgi:hypothetical protein
MSTAGLPSRPSLTSPTQGASKCRDRARFGSWTRAPFEPLSRIDSHRARQRSMGGLGMVALPSAVQSLRQYRRVPGRACPRRLACSPDLRLATGERIHARQDQGGGNRHAHRGPHPRRVPFPIAPNQESESMGRPVADDFQPCASGKWRVVWSCPAGTKLVRACVGCPE